MPQEWDLGLIAIATLQIREQPDFAQVSTLQPRAWFLIPLVSPALLALTWLSTRQFERLKTAVREKRNVHNVEPLEKMIPFVTSECPFGQNVSELASGVNVFDLYLWGPVRFCRTTSQEPLCGFEKHVSMLDFCL